MDERTRQLLMEYLLMSGQINPTQLDVGGGIVPQNEDALDFQRDAQDSQQDYARIMSDPMTAAMSGSGGYSPGAFTPTIGNGLEEVKRPGYQMLQGMKQRGENTVSRMIAEEIEAGGDAYSVREKLAAALNATPTTEEAAAAQEALRRSFPKQVDYATGQYITDPDSGQPMLDFESVFKDAQKLQDAVYADPSYDTEQGGRFFTAAPTAAEKWYKDQGLSTPDEQYTAQSLGGGADTAGFKQSLAEMEKGWRSQAKAAGMAVKDERGRQAQLDAQMRQLLENGPVAPAQQDEGRVGPLQAAVKGAPGAYDHPVAEVAKRIFNPIQPTKDLADFVAGQANPVGDAIAGGAGSAWDWAWGSGPEKPKFEPKGPELTRSQIMGMDLTGAGPGKPGAAAPRGLQTPDADKLAQLKRNAWAQSRSLFENRQAGVDAMRAATGANLKAEGLANALQAQGRTPLSDQLKQRRLQMFLMGLGQ